MEDLQYREDFTMTDDVSNLVDSYWKWMRDKTILKTVNDGWTEVNTPFFDRHNDGLQIYVRTVGDQVEITDDGYAISDLAMSGCNLKTPKQQSLLNKILMSNGITLQGESLFMKTDVVDFPSRKNDFINAMQQVGDLYITSRTNVYSLFSDEISLWLQSYEQYPVRNVRLQGSEGISYSVDFLFPPGRNKPERALQAIGSPTKEKVSWVIVMKDGLKKTRNLEMNIMLNDENLSGKQSEYLTKLGESRGVNTILWSKRDNLLKAIA